MIRLLAIIAGGIALFLFLSAGDSGGVLGCDSLGDFDCDAAINSQWGKWLGLPVSILGLVAYGTVFLASWLVRSRSFAFDDLGWRLLELTTPLIVGSGLWFVGLQFAGASDWCLYCLIVHLCGLLIAVTVVVLRVRASDGDQRAAMVGMPGLPGGPGASSSIASTQQPPPSLGVPTLLGLMAVGVLVGGQLAGGGGSEVVSADKFDGSFDFEGYSESASASESSKSSTNNSSAKETPKEELTEPENSDTPLSNKRRNLRSKPREPRTITALNGGLKLDMSKHAVIGNYDAPHVIIELMDYACTHCREFSKTLEKGLKRYDGQIAVVVFPAPGDVLCNKYVKKNSDKRRGACRIAKLSMAVAKLEPAEWPEFHEWLLKGEEMPNYTTASVRARRIANEKELPDVILSDEIASRIEGYIEYHAQLSRSHPVGLPCRIVGNVVVQGKPKSIDSMCQVWQEQFGIESAEGSDRKLSID